MTKRNGRRGYLPLAILAAFLAHPGAVRAQGAFAGSWTVVKAEAAPWLTARPELQPSYEPKLKNAKFVFRADRLDAPIWIACRHPHYEITRGGPEMLFEGGLDDPEHGLNDPKGLAAKLGFKGDQIETLAGACSELSYHLADNDTILFGLNNVIYTLKRDPPK
jgi:hypothetical protein